MVELITAVVEDAAVVPLEVGSIDGNGDGSLLESPEDTIAVTRANVNVVVDPVSTAACSLAPGVITEVWVSLFGGDAVALNVIEGSTHVASAASVASVSRTVDQVLFRQREELTSRDLASTFDSASRGEGPAGAAATLVLDTSNGSTGNPIDIVVGRRRADFFSIGSFNFRLLNKRQVGLRELFRSQVEERSHAVGVIGLNDFPVHSEHFHSVLLGFGIGESLVVHFLEFLPFREDGFVFRTDFLQALHIQE